MSELDGILNTALAVDPSSTASQDSEPTQQNDDAPLPDSEADGAVDSPDGEEGKQTEQTEDKSGDGQKAPTSAQIRQTLKAFRDSSPEHSQAAKILNDSYGRAEAYTQAIGSVEDARNIRTQLDAIGGLEGLSGLQSKVTNFENTDNLILSGDPSVLDQLIEDAPDGFKKLAPAYLSKLEKLDAETFGRTLQPHFVKALTAAGFPNVVNFLMSKLGDKPEALEAVKSMQDWFNQQKQLSDRYNTDAASPEQDKLKEGWTNLEKERRADLEGHIRTTITPHIHSTLGGSLKNYSESLKALPVGQRNAIAAATITELGRALEADKAYKAQVNALMSQKKPDRAKIVDFNKQKVSTLAPKIIEKIVKDFGLKPNTSKPGTKPATRRAANTDDRNKNTPRTIVKLSQAPRDQDIDWNHDLMSDEAYIRGRAVLKDGRWVSWK